MRLYTITDSLDEALVDRVSCALDGGATVVQLRLKGASARDLYVAGSALLPICRAAGALFVVNDRLDIALALGADGVHLGPEDLPIDAARRIVPERFIIGGSAGTVEAALAAAAAGADYLGVGAIYDARASKANASPPRGVEVLREICRAVTVPVVAIGGITEGNAAECIEAGASGVAVIRAVYGQQEIAQATRALRTIIERVSGKPS